jgi:hypothetical protein
MDLPAFFGKFLRKMGCWMNAPKLEPIAYTEENTVIFYLWGPRIIYLDGPYERLKTIAYSITGKTGL